MDEKTATEIRHWYNLGKGSIQDLARIYRVSVDDVLKVVGESNLGSVAVSGDLIDAGEAGPGADMNYGKTYQVPFSTD